MNAQRAKTALPVNQHAQLALAFPQQAQAHSPWDLLQQVQEPPALHVQVALAFPQQAHPQSFLDLPQQAQESEEALACVIVGNLLSDL